MATKKPKRAKRAALSIDERIARLQARKDFEAARTKYKEVISGKQA